MAKVMQYLDCGCAIMSDGTRATCPSCAAGTTGRKEIPPPPPETSDKESGIPIAVFIQLKDKTSVLGELVNLSPRRVTIKDLLDGDIQTIAMENVEFFRGRMLE